MKYPLTVVIPTAGKRPELLKRALISLTQCQLPRSYVETIVIENGVREKTESITEQFFSSLRTRYLFCEQPNKSIALNTALENVKDGLILFLDDDVRVLPEILLSYDAATDVYGPGHCFGGPIRCDYEREPMVELKPLLPRSARGWEPEIPIGPVNFNFLGANWAAFLLDIARIGGFDTNHGPGAGTLSTGQETEMQKRLRANGVQQIYIPEAKVAHFVPEDRCDWTWLSQRAFREGVEKAFDVSGSGSMFRFMQGFLWRYIYCVVGNALIALFTGSKSRYYRMKRHYRRLRGAWVGCRMMRQYIFKPDSEELLISGESRKKHGMRLE